MDFSFWKQELLNKAIEVSQEAHGDWERRTQEERAEIFLRAGDLVAGKYRMDLMAATMLGQVKAHCLGIFFFFQRWQHNLLLDIDQIESLF